MTCSPWSRLAAVERVPLVTRGAGTGLAGGSVALAGGIVLALTHMNRVVELDECQHVGARAAGSGDRRSESSGSRHGLFYPPDPASQRQSTIGGNAAMGAGGPHGLKYGTTKDYVLGLEAVTADGRVMRTGGKMIKNVTGYNLTQLLVGSEGTLGGHHRDHAAAAAKAAIHPHGDGGVSAHRRRQPHDHHHPQRGHRSGHDRDHGPGLVALRGGGAACRATGRRGGHPAH